MTQDLNKRISSIQYNLLNLPQNITYSTGSTIAYTYDAAGRKLHVAYGSPSSTIDYCGNMIYENGTLKQILIDDGYVTFSGTTPVYHYYLKDHQGNNRVVMNASGTIEQVNHYFPFGYLFGESTNASTQTYKYNGKEFDMMHGLHWYDYGARHYDPCIMRFTTMDPMCEKYYNISPYAYCGNNPVNAVDPSGRDWYEDEDGHLQWDSNLTIENAGELLSKKEKYLSYSAEGRVYGTDASGRFYYGDKESAIYSSINSGFAQGFRLSFGGYLSLDMYNKQNLYTHHGITDFENNAMNWGIGLGLVSFNYGYGTENGYNNGLYKSYGFSIGNGIGVSFGPNNTKYLKKY